MLVSTSYTILNRDNDSIVKEGGRLGLPTVILFYSNFSTKAGLRSVREIKCSR